MPFLPTKKFAVIAILAAVTLFGLVGYKLYLCREERDYLKGQKSYTAPQPPQESPQEASQSSDEQDRFKINAPIEIIPSLDGNLSFYWYLDRDSFDTQKCGYAVIDKRGRPYELGSKYMGEDTQKIPCSNGMWGFYTNSFKSWAEGNKLVMEFKPGTLKIIDLGSSEGRMAEADDYTYDTSKFSFIAVSKDLDHFLFEKKQEAAGNNDKKSFTILSRDKETKVEDLLPNENNWALILYDSANDGFLVIKRDYKNEKFVDYRGVEYYQSTTVKFNFIPVSTLNPRHLMTTEPAGVVGIGCKEGYLLSIPGEIILTPGCLTVSKKYLGKDGNIHIKL